ncbi:hypothetical protein HDU85_004742 [Gaertneriomyces sp. JEL0708]|nr:hypothetical protein HDU85_004742 [Gaertneriomyces sp. JEL0708]
MNMMKGKQQKKQRPGTATTTPLRNDAKRRKPAVKPAGADTPPSQADRKLNTVAEATPVKKTRTPPVKEQGKKKGKKFPSQDQMINLIQSITAEQDAKISRLLQKQTQVQVRHVADNQKKQDRAKQKRDEIESAKRKILEGQKEKRKIKKAKEEEEKIKAETKGTATRRVRFSV